MDGLVVRFDLKDATAAEQFDAIVARTLPLIAEREPGTLRYTVHSVVGEPLARVFYERYDGEEAFAAHEASPHTRAMLDAFGDLLRTAPRVERCSASAGAGEPLAQGTSR